MAHIALLLLCVEVIVAAHQLSLACRKCTTSVDCVTWIHEGSPLVHCKLSAQWPLAHMPHAAAKSVCLRVSALALSMWCFLLNVHTHCRAAVRLLQRLGCCFFTKGTACGTSSSYRSVIAPSRHVAEAAADNSSRKVTSFTFI